MQLVSVDDDLLCELDALDASGLSLLHYCCMYNLTVLVLVLLNRLVTSLVAVFCITTLRLSYSHI